MIVTTLANPPKASKRISAGACLRQSLWPSLELSFVGEQIMQVGESRKAFAIHLPTGYRPDQKISREGVEDCRPTSAYDCLILADDVPSRAVQGPLQLVGQF